MENVENIFSFICPRRIKEKDKVTIDDCSECNSCDNCETYINMLNEQAANSEDVDDSN